MKLDEFYTEFHHWLINRGPNYVGGLIIFFIGLWFIKFLRARLRMRMMKRGIHSSLQPFFLSLTITALYVLLIIWVMNIIGLEMSIFTTIIGAFSVAAGLALSGTFQNFAGGVLILLLKPFEIDDSIVAQGQDGRVVSIQMFYTVLITADNKTVIIPNGKLFNEVIVNITREGRRRLDFELRVGYNNDIEKAKAIMTGVVNANEDILHDPAARVGVISLDNDCVRFTINVWVDPADFLNAKINLQEQMLKELAAGGVNFPKPGF
ncbi:mechanosensitive ion channel [Mucilaginibacter rubeus]|uniref:Mechanosensitive ion channel n=1 Tax=Mucilaginibacter rubeus TaxID=2027860 RepID=A0AAE6JKY6_9SPHI|nr:MULTISPECIES: mechanosensitive ion channel domain-containing protein [Mucilaginibacter]QEM07601.1 mechanosensitive ion channel [Mucilaginibacter rubeus]QEM20055.1 mechanosensitive ion channel [Mucilaginibacter gossypii]QTE43234.1 mechanosensitive ion channel [Mucilaginibacter rubeus]QTE49834.1 mechanosensitive ion channel [Mucilaginibacter rubeus]QTE54926.1 mechanosensitive ion channel [Mucilaginibacter rubeus]